LFGVTLRDDTELQKIRDELQLYRTKAAKFKDPEKRFEVLWKCNQAKDLIEVYEALLGEPPPELIIKIQVRLDAVLDWLGEEVGSQM